jgi:gliding motility-associated-like protein
MNEIYFTLRLIVSSFLLVLFSFSANAQLLQAGFTTDQAGGCSPLTIAFTNTTTGSSANASYKWDLGNSNTAALPNAAATYITEQTYSITLTVTDAGKSSSVTRQITVYKRPAADFSFDTKKGCLPLAVNFAAMATPGDGTISNYFWDFGDGNTLQTPAAQIQHTYNLSQNTSVGLTVMNNYGCYTSVEKTAVQVLPAINPAFSVNDTFLCNIADPVSFNNASTGPGSLNYLWDFGDGTVSTSLNPTHIYNKKGAYTIQLTVSNSAGCASTTTQTNYIKVANFAPGFKVPQPVCINSLAAFKDTSTPGGSNKQWFADGVNITGNYYDSAFNYQFPSTGEHLIYLTAAYGKCNVADTQKVLVNSLPDIKPFIIDTPKYCRLPVMVNFKDTTIGAVSWEWKVGNFSSNVFSTTRSTAYEVLYAIQSDIVLSVKNTAGCVASEYKYVNIDNDYGGIQAISRTGCDSITIVFKAGFSRSSIISYQWDFGDAGSSSQLAEPSHTYTKTGSYIVTLKYTTDNGCTGTLTYTDVNITRKPSANFTLPSGNTICGNTATKFLSTSTGDYWTPMWSIAKSGSTVYETIGFNSEQFIQFSDTGFYNVQLVLYSNEASACNDTMTKLNFVKILPAIPKIKGYLNTCDATRGLVRFTENSINPTTWIWDFGDNTTLSYNSKQDTTLHTYIATGYYKVRLTAQNGACSVSDSIYTAVLLKQQPILSVETNNVCTNGSLKLWLGNYELNTDPHFIDSYDWDGNSIFKFQYGDGTTFTGAYNRVDTMGYWNPWYTQLTASLTNFKPFQTSFRAISTSAYFGCNDTSNYVPIKVNGAKADFTVSGNPCFEYPAVLQDISIAGAGASIVGWNWDFGDATAITKTVGGTELHVYPAPGQYTVLLKVTDANGCSDTISHYVNPSGPKAAFTYSPAQITPNSPVAFTNATNTFNSINTQYQWIFGDGNSSTDFAPSHNYGATGNYTVKLISTNPATQCKDTSSQLISVKRINTQFSFIKSYVSTSTCPPVIVHFTNTSSNAQRVAWDFGDGSIADNQNITSHTYYTPGTYKITMYGFGYNDTRDTTVDSIVVRAPFATLKADRLSGCLSQTITLNAVVTTASYITWDFADGTIKQTQDTFAVHQYTTPGLYHPSLILLDSGGCYLTAKLADTLIIDALTVTLPANKHYCDAASVFFNPTVTSVAAASLNQPLSYHWNFGTGQLADTANILRPSFNYNNPGSYFVSLQVQSPYGCVKLATDSIIVSKGSAASITGPADICQGATAIFTGQATNNIPGITWKWDLGNGTAASQQNPPPIVFADSGNFRILLVVTNAGCADTAIHLLTVHRNPVINASPQQTVLCLGSSISLHAGGGISYSWSPATGLDNNNIASPVASPLISTSYLVKVRDVFGCSNTDSLNIKVAQPFSIQVSGDKDICAGNSVALLATGAITYNWINTIAGLSNTQVGNPVATPAATIQYTVVGYDANHCFTDTASIHIRVNPLPVIHHQPDVETLGGIPVQLQASGSADIISWSWQPANYLSCSDCAAPICTPLRPVTYIATGSTQFGCTVADTLLVKLACAISQVYVPSVFSPNNDGVNDVFIIQGNGVKSILWMRIFNRYGEIIFEKRNSQVGDRSAGWNGMVKNAPASPGTYIYMAELTCDSGEVFPLKGTVILIK